MRPGITLQRPLIAGIFFAQFFRDFAENGVIVRRFVMTYAAPVDRLRNHAGVSVRFNYRGIALLAVREFLFHESDAGQTHFQARAKPILRQVTFDPVTLNAFRIRD